MPWIQRGWIEGRSTLLNGMIAYWKLDEASGSRADSVGSNTLTDNNTVTQAAGQVGNAAQCTAVNSEYLDIVDNTTLSMGDIDFEVAGGLYLDSKSNFRFALAKRTTSSSNTCEYQIWYDNGTDRLNFSVSDGSTGLKTAVANNLGSPSTGTWYYVRGWHDSVNNVIGISINNGTANTTAHTTGVLDGAGNLYLGRNWAGGVLYWDGRLDDTKIWKGRLLSTAERAEDYANWVAGRALV